LSRLSGTRDGDCSTSQHHPHPQQTETPAQVSRGKSRPPHLLGRTPCMRRRKRIGALAACQARRWPIQAGENQLICASAASLLHSANASSRLPHHHHPPSPPCCTLEGRHQATRRETDGE
jgi:hypothetical protein